VSRLRLTTIATPVSHNPMHESNFSVATLPADFPLDDLALIGKQLEEAGLCVPGYVPPEVGLFATQGMLFAEATSLRTILLPDRNVVSRMAQLGQGRTVTGDEQLRLAAALLGFCQCFDVEIEPSIAYHELAHKQGNVSAWDELPAFRLADSAHAQETLNVALGRSTVLRTRGTPPHAHFAGDLALPLRKWRRNYVIAHKIVELEFTALKPLQRALQLLDWMTNDFLFGGPAALTAFVYLAPNSPPKKKVFKDLRSPNREAAVAGVRNAAWDMAHLSDFIFRVNAEGESGRTRYIFASFDKFLRLIANLSLAHATEWNPVGLAGALSAWWPEQDASVLAHALFRSVEQVSSPEWNKKPPISTVMLETMVNDAEQKFLGATPGASG
jgi:hypothetical protein